MFTLLYILFVENNRHNIYTSSLIFSITYGIDNVVETNDPTHFEGKLLGEIDWGIQINKCRGNKCLNSSC